MAKPDLNTVINAKSAGLILLAAALLVGLSVGLLAGCGIARPVSAPPATRITILHINDHHSHLEPHRLPLALPTPLTTAGALAGKAEVELNFGGFALLASAVEALDGPSVIKLHAGDAITGTLYYSLFAGQADAAAMNAVCWDAFALGNHEFDHGDSGLAKFLDYLGQGDCDTAVLAANVRPGVESPLRRGYLTASTTIEVEGGRIGLIGIDTAAKTRNSSHPDPGTRFLDETTTAQAEIDRLRSEGIDKIILLTHITHETDLDLARALDGVDVIVGGDSHTLLGGASFTALGFAPEGPYPRQVEDRAGNPVCVVTAWEYARVLGRLDVEFDREGRVSHCTGAPVLPVDGRFTAATDGAGRVALNDFDSAALREYLRRYPEIMITNPEPRTEGLIAGFAGRVAQLQQQVVGRAGEHLCLVRWPGEARSSVCDVQASYRQGSAIANIVARAFLEVTPGADIAIQNGGGVRTDLRAGAVTVADAYTLLPFANTLVTMKLSGAELKQVLEDALAETLDDNGSSGSYPYAAGLRYKVDASRPFGQRISNLQVNPRLAGAWVAVSAERFYTVVTNNFIAAGQDGYDTFAKVYSQGRVVDTFVEYAQGFIDYLDAETRAGRALRKPQADEYSTQVYIGRDGCDHSQRVDCASF